MTTLCLKNSSITESEINKNLALCNLCLSQGTCLINICQLIHNSIEMSFHHRVTQSLTEFYSFDFKLIKLCETLCPLW